MIVCDRSRLNQVRQHREYVKQPGALRRNQAIRLIQLAFESGDVSRYTITDIDE
jgi:hypothetical protein